MQLADLPSPRVSVVICNHNYAQYIQQALHSVFAQTRPAHELIVVDDGSTDESVAVMQPLLARPGCKLVQQDNGGQTSAYNTGFAHTTGDVVLFLDADDALLPNALEEVSLRFTAGVAKVHFRLRLMGSDGKSQPVIIPTKLDQGEVAQAFLSRGVPHASPPASGNAYRREVLQRLFPLPFDPVDRHGADFFCVYGSALYGRVAACEQPLGLYRVHAQQPVVGQTPSFSFGNAAKALQQAERQKKRLARMKAWLAQREPGKFELPERWREFAIEKSAFAGAALGAGAGPIRRSKAWRLAPQVLDAIWAPRTDALLRKLGLTAWVLLLLVAPYPLALRAAHYVCDPGSRHSVMRP